ncbi:MAG: O-antigen ligase family protein [Clostridia bacterium]
MKEKIITNLKYNWILFIIVLQPILDIISYFQSKYMESSYTWIIRIILLLLIFIISFIHSKDKKKLILKILPFALFFTVHILNLSRIHQFNLLEDTRYFILVFQMPILYIALVDYIKNTNYDLNKIRKGICYNFIIIVISIFLSYITNTYQHTYITGIGITGWFSSANTISMILCAITPWVLYVISNSKNILIYLIAHIIAFIVLFTNATRACYLTLLASLLVLIFMLVLSKKESKKLVKVLITSAFVLLSIFGYKFSFTSNKEVIANNVTKQYVEDIKDVVSSTESQPCQLQNIDFDNINIDDNEMILKILKTSYIYEELIDIHGEQAVVEAIKPYLSAEALSNNRLRKVLNAKIDFNNSDVLTKFLGIGYSRIAANKLDLENDLQGIFYYYGYLGFIIYIAFILYFIIRAVIIFFKNPSVIHDKEYIVLLFILALLIVGGEYSGAFLRKSNASIYLSLYLVLLAFKLQQYDVKTAINKKKISFLLLHLGYGGIETSTINTANALSQKYDVELISFYNLKENQTQYINKNISIKYLYQGGPNKSEFTSALKEKNIIKIIKEGCKSADILIKKKFLIKKEIIYSDSFAIISTRYDFSSLLSKYGRKNIIKIAQEHHHHNNDKKYIGILKHKYKNIDYLFALTKGLKEDYTKFLKNNKHTKILVVPNMIQVNTTIHSNLNNKNIISICRLDKGKKIDELINIFSQLKDKESKLYIIGDGEEKSNIERLILDLDLQNRVIMTGYLNKDEQTKYLQNSSIYAMTSVSEGLPMVLLEAMSFGIPCIAYKTQSGVCDIIDGSNGFVIDNRNQMEYLEKLELLLYDSELRYKMSLACIDKSNQYTEEKIIKYWIEILENYQNI